MVGRYGRRAELRRVAVAAALTTSLIAPAAISAQEAEQPAAPPPPTGEALAAPPVPAAEAPPAAPPPPAESPATAVTVSRANASATKAVSIVNFDFSPAAITVNTGDTVQWTNKDAAPEGHDVTGDGLDSGLMNQGDNYSFSFDSAGSYSYICTIHPSMTGSVEVLARSSGSGDDAGGGSSSGTDSSAAVTESEAIGSPDAAGTAVSLPASGEPVAGLAAASMLLLALGLGLRLLPALRARD